MDDSSNIFNRKLYQMRRNRSAEAWENYNFLKREAAERLADKLEDVTRRFPLALDLGCHQGELEKAIALNSSPRRGEVRRGAVTGIDVANDSPHPNPPPIGEGVRKIDHIIRCDFAQAMQPDLVCDEELLPFAPESFDLVASALSLHHVNDLPGALIQLQHCLKPDGLFLAILPGANTLKELRASITAVSAEQAFALSPRLSPLVEIRDAGALLQRAGFALPVVDSETLTVEYDSAWKLFQDLHGMGESNVLLAQHKGFTSRAQLAAIAAYYEMHFGKDGVIPATFELVTLTGWKPHISQQKPAQRGSGKVNLKHLI